MRTWMAFVGGAVLGAASVAALTLPWERSRTVEIEGVRPTSPRAPPAVAAPDRALGRGGRAPETTLGGHAASAPPIPEEAEFLRAALAEERRRRLAAVIQPADTGIDILRRVVVERSDPTELMSDFDRFAARVHSASGPTLRLDPPREGQRIDLREAAAGKVAVLEFGPGRFEIDTRPWGDRREDVDELEIRGAGKDKTTLVAKNSDLLFLAKAAKHVRIHDLTFDGGTGGEMCLDVRGKAAVVVEDVRFLGWSSGGHSAAIGVSGGAYLGLRRCEFLGGRRENAGRAAISIRGSSIVLASSCTFTDLSAAVYGSPGTTLGSHVRLEDCEYFAAPVAGHVTGEDGRPWFPIVVEGGRVHIGSDAIDRDERALRWGAGQLASGAGTVEYGPDPGLPTLGGLLAVLDQARPPPGAVPYAIELVMVPRLDLPGLLRLHTLDPKQGARSWTLEGPGGQVGAVSADAKRRPPTVEQVAAAGSLGEAVRRSGQNPAQQVSSLALEEAMVFRSDRAEARLSVTLLDGRSVLVGWIDAKTGEWTPSPWK